MRAPTRADVPAITAIYNEGIEGREATFETRLRDPREVEEWLASELPFLVAEDRGTVVGWARAQRGHRLAAALT